MATITIYLSEKARVPIKINWETSDGTAIAGKDYKQSSGVIDFNVGEREKKISIDIIPVATNNIRQFFIELSEPVNVTIKNGHANCKIIPRLFNGPLIKSSLMTNAYDRQNGRGNYFHYNAGTSEGQAIAIESGMLAWKALQSGSEQDKTTGDWFRLLAISMLGSIGDGSLTGPMLRQPFPSSPDTITLLHWLFAAKGDVPTQAANYSFVAPAINGKLRIPRPDVFDVWMIYPTEATLLYDSPYSPAFDASGNEVQVKITEWKMQNGEAIVTIPAGAPSKPEWKVGYGYSKGLIKQGKAFEAFPFWTAIPDGYSACAPDTFRWFDMALTLAIPSLRESKWSALQGALRKSAVRGQSITDLREILKPLPKTPVFPATGQPDGMFCYSSHADAESGQGGLGYNFWRREQNGNIEGVVPAGQVLSQTQIGRGVSDQWREPTSYQDADGYLWLEVSCSLPLDGGEAYVFLSSTKNYSAATRWYAKLKSLPNWAEVVSSFNAGKMANLYVPRSLFLQKDGDNSVLPAGTRLENFGVSIDHAGGYTVRIGSLRLVKDQSPQARLGAVIPYFPGAMPFAINADTVSQQFVGWNGSPFHGYQLPDYWFYLSEEADAVHPNLTNTDLVVADPSTGALSSPISAFSVDGYAKPRAALLMEQQLLFLKHAQERWVIDGGDKGPFAHTFVINTTARQSIGNPTPHTWIYTNDDPNTRWSGYQARVVESLARLTWVARFGAGYKTSRDLSAQMATDWLSWLKTAWPELSGVIRGMPTDFPDPRISKPFAHEEEPHVPAIIIRACLWLKLSGYAGADLDQLIQRCWEYIDSMWVEKGPMRYTWCPDPNYGNWFGFWHFEIITTISFMLDEGKSVRPASITDDLLRSRLRDTAKWLKEIGVE